MTSRIVDADDLRGERRPTTRRAEHVDTINRWQAEGYGANFVVEGAVLRCGKCNDVHDPRLAEILDVARFEGASDPDDESVAFALRCVHCGTRGILVAAYGPNASPEEADESWSRSRTRRPRG